MTAWGWGGGNDKSFTLSSPVTNGAWHQVGHHLRRDLAGPVRRRRRAAVPDRDAEHRLSTPTDSGSGRSSTPATPAATPVASSTARSTRSRSTQRCLTRRRSPPTPGLRRRPARRHRGSDRRVSRRDRAGGHRLTVRTLDNAEPGAGTGTDPSGIATTGNAAARHGVAHRRQLRHLRRPCTPWPTTRPLRSPT